MPSVLVTGAGRFPRMRKTEDVSALTEQDGCYPICAASNPRAAALKLAAWLPTIDHNMKYCFHDVMNGSIIPW